MLRDHCHRIDRARRAIAALAAAMLVCVQLGCAGRPSKPATAGIQEDPAKAARERQIRAAAAEGIVAGGIEAYRAGDIDKARDFFTRALPDLKPRIHPVNDALAFLPLGKHPLLVPAIEKDFGRISAEGRAAWVDAEGGFAVLDRAFAERIAAAYMPGPTEQPVLIETAIIEIPAPTAREWSKRLTSDIRPREWVHPWKPPEDSIPSETEIPEDVLNRLDWHFPNFVRTVKYDRCTQVLATPCVYTNDRTGTLLGIGTTPYTAPDDRGAGKKAASGLSVWLWPRIEGDRMRLLLHVWIGDHRGAGTLCEHDLMVPVGGEAMVLGRAPSDKDVEKGESLTWLCVRARIVDRPILLNAFYQE